MERSELRLECLKLAHDKIQPREKPEDTIVKAESYYEFVSKPEDTAKVPAPSPGKGKKNK